MGTTWRWIKNLPLRSKLTLGYTTAFVILLLLLQVAVYAITERYRQREFYQRLEDRMMTTFTILLRVTQIDQEMLQLFDRNTINNLSEEKVLLFDSTGHVIYSSIDDTRITYSTPLLRALMAGGDNIKLTERGYEVLGIQFTHEGRVYYGIAKAFDRFGKSKMQFLFWVLVASFFVCTALLVAVSFYLSGIITHPIRRLTRDVDAVTPQTLSTRVSVPDEKDEVAFLAARFNDLLARLEQAFRFQGHFIHHLSHELKTPLSVMMTNTERALAAPDEESRRSSLAFQRHALMELSQIIDALLEISKMETIQPGTTEPGIRLDELLFQCMEEAGLQDEAVRFDFRMENSIEDSDSLTVRGNSRMLKMALGNLLKNAIAYSTDKKPEVVLSATPGFAVLHVLNDGPLVREGEREQLFDPFFRGTNATATKGFGIGLVLVRRIAGLLNGTVRYFATESGRNCFELVIPQGS